MCVEYAGGERAESAVNNNNKGLDLYSWFLLTALMLNPLLVHTSFICSGFVAESQSQKH